MESHLQLFVVKNKNACSAIYYLLEGDQFSAFHRLKSDELLHFYDGSSMTLHIIETDGRLNQVRLGPDIDNKETFQAVVKAVLKAI
ncbi:MAG TPA: cupin domain-containing protein [Candidatus Bathyarchaeia archaeon]|nr:cupin domain-containing protein [Candidatus Bathyarchaeia archaeon]